MTQGGQLATPRSVGVKLAVNLPETPVIALRPSASPRENHANAAHKPTRGWGDCPCGSTPREPFLQPGIWIQHAPRSHQIDLTVPHPVPPLPALYGLFRDKKIKKCFRSVSSRRDNRRLASYEVAGSLPMMHSVLKGRWKTPTHRNTMVQSFSLKSYIFKVCPEGLYSGHPVSSIQNLLKEPFFPR